MKDTKTLKGLFNTIKNNTSNAQLPKGVYVIYYIGDIDNLHIDPKSTDGFSEYDPQKLTNKLKESAKADEKIIYIGKASGEGGLFERLKQYFHKSGHNGGRAIWQIHDIFNNDNIKLKAYICSAPNEPENFEKDLLKAYKEDHNETLPMANWRL